MSNSALDIEYWKKVNFINGKTNLSFKYRVSFMGLNIPASKFYFFLKEKFGKPNVLYSSVAQFFPEKKFSGNEWCFAFQESSNFILVCGDDKINITVLSIAEPPNKLDFDLFSSRISNELKTFSLKEYNHIGADLYINYSFVLKNLISEFKNIVEKQLPSSPVQLELTEEDLASKDPEIQYKYIENCKDYNHWLKLLLEKATYSLKIQIMMPIYFESLILLAFRIKLKKEFFNREEIYEVNHGRKKIMVDIFNHFERLPIHSKIAFIKEKCTEVNTQRIDEFIASMLDDYISGDENKVNRNKLLHGNPLYFRNLNAKYYLDESYFIGFPDRARGVRIIADSIKASIKDKMLLKTISIYEKQCDDFINIFEDNGYLKSLVSAIAFAHNAESGGCVSIGINKYEDLFAPTEFR